MTLTRRGYQDGLGELALIRRQLEATIRAGELRLAEAEGALARDRRLLAFVDACSEIFAASLADRVAVEDARGAPL